MKQVESRAGQCPIDPHKAQRVWERVRASMEPADPCPCPAPDLPPLPVYTPPKEAWDAPRQPARQHSHGHRNHQRRQPSPDWSCILILWLLLAAKCC